MHKFDRFRRVRLRDIWPHEARDFTPWLAENLLFLAEALDMELELEAAEKRIGDFRADIVCRNRTDNSRVVIENQLEKSNHQHLGKILTYAAGLDAAAIVWIVAEFRDEHRETLDWLNKSTHAALQFFGVELAVFQITDSPYAPEFTVVTNIDA
ncbi:MAG: hypothetical protein OXI63_07140 [Candidatus Poribacteria bacterium]|nr:hypothetical protein [Candidatus Poribacteria bacterium]